MKKQYLHLSVFRCDKCQGPVVRASLAVRENEISKETDKQEIGAACLSCRDKPDGVTALEAVGHFPPTEWQASHTVDPASLKNVFVEMLESASRD